MSLSNLPLSYCTNVHPGTTIAEVEAGLVTYTAEVQKRLATPLAAGLWLAAPVVRELQATPDELPRFGESLRRLGLVCYTLNAFPYGDFHSPRVKENVYLPDWSRPERLAYTRHCAEVLAALLPDGVEGSISTVPLGFKSLAGSQPADFVDQCLRQLIELSHFLRELHQRTGKLIRLAIEPEPLCVLETTAETLDFFRRLWAASAATGSEAAVRQHLGVCYDVCHQAVEFEDVAASIRAFQAAGIRLNKIHISCALQLDDPRDPDAREALARYAEPRYLHQTFARRADGRIVSQLDLSRDFAQHPPADFAQADSWRVHFHVPVDAERLGPLATTRADLKRALAAVAGLDYAPHLEVETYTWEVLPDAEGKRPDLVTGIARELAATAALLRR